VLSGRVNRTGLRTVVIAIGFGVAAYYFWNLYGPAGFRIGGEGAFEDIHTNSRKPPTLEGPRIRLPETACKIRMGLDSGCSE